MEKSAERAAVPLKSVEVLYEVLEADGISTDFLNLSRRYASGIKAGDSCRLAMNYLIYDVFFRTDGMVDRIVKGETTYYENRQFVIPIGK